MSPTNVEKHPAPVAASKSMEVSVRRPQPKTRVGEDVRDLTALISLSRPTDMVVEDEIKWQTRALKAQAIAALLLAILQSQIIFSSPLITSFDLLTATTSFSAVGVVLNVVGACYALISAYYLDHNLFGVQAFVRGLSSQELAEIRQVGLSPLAKKLARQNSLNPIGIRQFEEEERGVSGDRLFRATSLEKYSRSIEEHWSAAYLASATIALGFLCFPVAFLCLLHGTQPIAVCIAADTVVGVLLFIRFLVIPLQDRLQNLMGRRIIPP